MLVYRRTEKPKVELSDPELAEKLAQFKRVEAFFAQFRNADGSLKGGVNEYATASDFRGLLRENLEEILFRRLKPPLGEAPSTARHRGHRGQDRPGCGGDNPDADLYPVHVMTRKSFGLMTRKLSVTESQRSAQFRGTVSRRKPSVASANWAHVA